MLIIADYTYANTSKVPFLTLQKVGKFSDAIDLYKQTFLGTEGLDSEHFKYESLLLQYYTKPEDPKGLHISRTLDQYYYSALSDTTRRDIDQVVRRYYDRKRNENGKN